jgi:hypothetical protein
LAQAETGIGPGPLDARRYPPAQDGKQRQRLSSAVDFLRQLIRSHRILLAVQSTRRVPPSFRPSLEISLSDKILLWQTEFDPNSPGLGVLTLKPARHVRDMEICASLACLLHSVLPPGELKPLADCAPLRHMLLRLERTSRCVDRK